MTNGTFCVQAYNLDTGNLIDTHGPFDALGQAEAWVETRIQEAINPDWAALRRREPRRNANIVTWTGWCNLWVIARPSKFAEKFTAGRAA